MGKIDILQYIEQLNYILRDIQSIDAILVRVKASGSDDLYPDSTVWSLNLKHIEDLRLILLNQADSYRKDISSHRNHLLPGAPQESTFMLEFQLTPERTPNLNKDLSTTHDLTRPNRI